MYYPGFYILGVTHSKNGANMSAQGFILVRLADTLSEEGLWELVWRFEDVEGVELASRVIGPFDFVLTVDTTGTLDQVLEQVRTVQEGEATGLKTSDEFIRHREMRDLKVLRDLISPPSPTGATVPDRPQ